jgi:tetratricopeptide (TPR) repeat protein
MTSESAAVVRDSVDTVQPASTARRRTLRVSAMLAAAVAPVLFAGAPVFGQARPGAANPRAVGLDSLPEENVLNELAGRGLQGLLNRQFDALNVSPQERQSFAALQAIRELGGPRPYSENRRVELMEQSVKGLEALLPKISDPNVLENYANTLLQKGIEPDVKMLEYFGDSPVIMARARPAAALVIKMLEKVASDAVKRSEFIANQIKNPDDPNIDVVEKLDATASRAKYTANIVAYYEVMGINLETGGAKALTERKEQAGKAIKELRVFDSNESGVVPIVKTQIAKLFLASRDIANARKEFQLVVDGKVLENGKPVDMNPPPVPAQVNDAKYFLVVADIVEKKPDQALKRMTELEQWQKANIKDAAAQQALGVTMGMLRYRVLAAQADLATVTAKKDELNREADLALEGVANSFPAFRPMIVDQMVSRLPKTNPDLSKQSELVVTTLMMRGNLERRKQATETVDAAALELGLKAARELAENDKRNPAVAAPLRDTASLLIPLFLTKQGKELEAGVAFMDYAQKFPKSPEAPRAMDQAANIIVRAYAAKPKDQQLRNLYKRVLDVLVEPPYLRVEWFYAAGDFYRSLGDPEAARKYYNRVPKGDRNEFNARYWTIDCINTLLTAVKDPVRTRELNEERTRLIDDSRRLGQAILAGNADPAVKEVTRYRLAYLTLETATRLMSENPPNTKRTLELLAGFEQQVQGVQGADLLINRAMRFVAEATMKEGRVDEALLPVQKLMGNPDPKVQASAIKLASEADEALQNEFAAAEQLFKNAADATTKATQKQVMAKAADVRTKYLGLLVPWLKANMPDDWKQKNMSTWAEREASLLRSAALLQDDPARRSELLTQAKAAFDGQFKQLKAAPTPADAQGQNARQALESTLMFRLAQCNFDLGNFDEAAKEFGVLVAENRLGPPVVQTAQLNGAVKEADNPAFWEGFYKREKSVLETIRTENNPDAKKRRLDLLVQRLKDGYIIYGEKIGGEQWKASIDGLRKEVEAVTGQPLIVTAPAGGGPATAPATAPAK